MRRHRLSSTLSFSKTPGRYMGPGRHMADIKASILFILPLGLALLLVLGACNGGGEEPTPQAPAATQTPATEATGRDATQPLTGTEEIFVPASQFREMELSLNAGDVVRIDYTAEFRIVGRSESGGNVGGIESGVEFAVVDPFGGILFQAEQLSENEIIVNAEIAGVHRLSFINPFTLQGQSVTINYAINP